jgi:hypothetical protein
MKIVNKIWILIIGIALMFSCTEILDTYPEGSTFSEEQKKEIVGKIPERLAADINGLYSMMGDNMPIYGAATGRDDDFGYPMVCLSADCNGPDMWSTDDNYNWFGTASSYEDRTFTYANPYMRWANFYNQIKSANDILASIPEDTDNETLLYYKGQALATRAFDYFSLAQMFQFTYQGNETQPAVPIVTFGMTDPENPRARLDTVYTLIMNDLNTAIPLLEGFQRTNKATVDQQVAYGIRARVNLVMGNYSEAASDAADARAGYTLLSREDVSTPSFYDVNESSWIWGVIVNAANISNNLATITSKLNSFTGYGYSTIVSCYKGINNLLWDMIPETDVRKGWWVDENLESPLLEGLVWGDNVGQEIGPAGDVKSPYIPYTNVKFGVEVGPGNTDNAEDFPIMRAEEMLLIEAEGKAMSGSFEEGKTILEDFVKNYRDDEYTCDATTPAELQDEIWFQRRVELWGEGFSMTDIMRLKKNMVRFKTGVDSNFPDAFKFNMSATDGYLLLRIPNDEISSNTGISEADNNSEGTLPQSGDGAGLTDGVVVK